jgi:hypothetical protein
MSQQVTGFDRETISTPFKVRRGSGLVVNRTCFVYGSRSGGRIGA